MLQEVLALMRRAGGAPISAEMIAAQLGISRDVAQHMVLLLVQRGRLVQVDGGCVACDVCPLHRFCAGASQGGIDREVSHGYRIRVP